MNRTGKLLALSLFTLCATFAEARAGNITAFGISSLPGNSTGTFGPVGNTPSPNNDNATTPSPNVVSHSIFFNSFGVADIEYVIANSGGTTEYQFTHVLFNLSGQPWTGYQFELGFGTGASFVRSGSSDSLDFDTVELDPTPFSTVFTTLNHQADTLDWAGGTVPVISTVFFSFAVDVSDNLQNFNPSGLNRFTLRQTPVVSSAAPVPEPATMLLLGTGVAGLAGVIRKRRKL